MKRKTLEKTWMIIVFIMLTMISILGVMILFEDVFSLEKLKYIAAITIISIPINMIMLFLCSNAKD